MAVHHIEGVRGAEGMGQEMRRGGEEKRRTHLYLSVLSLIVCLMQVSTRGG
jgi:hypothetical protein